MKRFLPLLFLLAASFAASAQTFVSQTDTFTFDKTQAITSYDGSDPANPPYPYDMGYVTLSNPNTAPSSGITVPWQLGYLNNGGLDPCDPIVWGPQVWIVGDGTHTGDTYTRSSGSYANGSFTPGPTACPYFTGEYGTYENSDKTFDSFSVVATYQRKFVRTCVRYGCHTNPVDTLQGGTGTITQTVVD